MGRQGRRRHDHGSYAPLDATFTGSWRDDDTFSGGWRPNLGADDTVNVPYDISGHRIV